jgi:hypothetical protein
MKRPAPPERRERLLVRESPMMSMRLWWMPGFRTGSRLPSSARVVWGGRPGHPSSYGLLGGSTFRQARLAVSSDESTYRDSLAGSADNVRWGLPVEYQAAVLDALTQQPRPVMVGTAAHGAIGSSSSVFRGLAVLLARLLATGVPDNDVEVWKLRDRCWND